MFYITAWIVYYGMIYNGNIFVKDWMDKMSRWFFINFLVILFLIWRITTSYFNIPILFGILGFSFFMFNWMRHAMFATIRANISRKWKVRVANISKVKMPFHKWTGTIAFLFIVIHMILVIRLYGFQTDNFKMMFGLMGCIVLFFTVVLGWFRWFRTTVRKRIWHLSLAFTLFYLIVIHIAL